MPPALSGPCLSCLRHRPPARPSPKTCLRPQPSHQQSYLLRTTHLAAVSTDTATTHRPPSRPADGAVSPPELAVTAYPAILPAPRRNGSLHPAIPRYTSTSISRPLSAANLGSRILPPSRALHKPARLLPRRPVRPLPCASAFLPCV